MIGVKEGFSARLWDVVFERATCAIDYEQPREQPIAWLAAEWDGKQLRIECRTTATAVLAPHVEVIAARSKSNNRLATHRLSGSSVLTRLPWSEGDGVPVLITIETGDGYRRSAAVHDVRLTEGDETLCGEFDEEQLREVLDRLLEERYGYLPHAVSDGTSSEGGPGGGVVNAGADYAVPAYVDARRRFQLIDNWWNELCDADERARPFILKDGRRILERWSAAAKSERDRGLRLAAKVAAEELDRRIRRSP